MLFRTLSALALASTIVTGVFAQRLVQLDTTTIEVGQFLVVELSGKVLQDYLRICNRPDKDMQAITMCAMVEEVLDDGSFRVEHSTHTGAKSKGEGLVTVTFTVVPTALSPYHGNNDSFATVDPKGETSAVQPLIIQDSNTAILRRSETIGMTLRSWTLDKKLRL